MDPHVVPHLHLLCGFRCVFDSGLVHCGVGASLRLNFLFKTHKALRFSRMQDYRRFVRVQCRQ